MVDKKEKKCPFYAGFRTGVELSGKNQYFLKIRKSELIHKKFTIRKCKKSASGLTVWRFFFVNEFVAQTILKNDAADFAISIDCDGVQHGIKEIL